MNERRIGSIPRRTMGDVWREQRFLGSSVSIGRLPPKEPGQSSFDVKRHVFQKPTGERPSEPFVSPENRRIMWRMEIHEDYNNAGDLGLIIQFSGISFSTPVFGKSRHNYGPDSCVFYSPVGYKNGQAFLILATFGDVFESQVVSRTKDVNPFFREEIYLPELLTRYDPTSMKPSYNNGLVIVSYKTRVLTP